MGMVILGRYIYDSIYTYIYDYIYIHIIFIRIYVYIYMIVVCTHILREFNTCANMEAI